MLRRLHTTLAIRTHTHDVVACESLSIWRRRGGGRGGMQAYFSGTKDVEKNVFGVTETIGILKGSRASDDFTFGTRS